MTAPGPDSLRALIGRLLAGSLIADDFVAHADAWEARERRIALLEGDLRTAKANWDAACDDAAKLEADNAALREMWERAKRALDWWDMDTLADALASQPDTKASTTADQRDKGPCWAGGNIAGD
jgi:hypothetical protein